ncbi:MAG: alkaline phosphatase family protein [Candidatus Binataceae bacterium]
MRIFRTAIPAIAGAIAIAAMLPPRAAARDRGRIVVLMVWDGLRPDAVTARDTPNLYRMARAGVRFDRNHAVFPTVTLVNSAALATGAPPGINGLEGNTIYATPPGKPAKGQPAGKLVSLEHSATTIALNAPDFYAGRLLGIDTIAQEVERAGGYLAAIGKHGPALMFDNRLMTIAHGKDELGEPDRNYLFLSDDLAEPQPAEAKLLAAIPPVEKSGVIYGARDAYFTRIAADDALPAAIRASNAGHPALIVLWQHNPDITQHAAGLGTAPALEALAMCDRNLGALRAAIRADGAADRTDLIVVSDHGFATIRMRIDLSALLASAGIEHSPSSGGIIVAPNGGADLVYLSRADFPTAAARRAILQRIVNFAEAQEWCGPIFSREPADQPPDPPHRHREHRHRARRHRELPKPYLGWIFGTFSQSAVGLYNPTRSPDLIISMLELPDIDNRKYTGPGKPAFLLGAHGEVATPNRSAPLVRPVKGVMYEDSGASTRWSTGMGMHGAAGAREIHNFLAAIGPDFRRGFVDLTPTANTDVAPGIAHLLGIPPNSGPGGLVPTGRQLTEAYAAGRHAAPRAQIETMTATLTLQGVEAISKIRIVHCGGESYLDGSSVDRKPLGSSP